MTRAVWLAVGLGAQVAFHLLVPALMWFMQFGAAREPRPPLAPAWGWWPEAALDLGLVLAFAVPHSILLAPPVRAWLARRMPAQLYGSLFTWATTASLVLLIAAWRPIPGDLWRLEGAAEMAMLVAAALAWLGLGYSMWLTGFGWQTGWTSFHAWWRHRADPPRGLLRHGAYAVFRHPIYLSFAAIAWTSPVMDRGHLLLSLAMTAYCLAGSVIKDRRLCRYLGDDYRRYMAAVPGWPGLPRGPLGRTG